MPVADGPPEVVVILQLRVADRDYNVFANTQFQQARPLGDVVVRAPTKVGDRTTGPVRVQDVAKVVDATADQNEIVRINGQRGVYLRVLKQPGANSIAVVDAVRAALPRLRGVPPTVKLAISFDQSSYIRAAMKALELLDKYDIPHGSNTQIGSRTMPQLRRVLHEIAQRGAKGWQIQLTVAMGNAVDNSAMLLQPHQKIMMLQIL